jgi:hypothetical protein
MVARCRAVAASHDGRMQGRHGGPGRSDRSTDVSDDTFMGGWAPYPESRDPHPGRTEVGDDGEVLDSSVQVVGVGAICGVDEMPFRDGDRSKSFWVSEFARLADGRRVILHDARGFTIGMGSGIESLQEGLTVNSITNDVLAVVLPDPEDGEDHPWDWLAHLARCRGLDVTAEELRRLSYEVILTDSVTRWLEAS